MVFCRVAGEKTKTNVAHYLFSLKVGVCTTAQAIFVKLNQLIVEHGLHWTTCQLSLMEQQPCKVLLMDMSEKSKTFQLVAVSTHCMIH